MIPRKRLNDKAKKIEGELHEKWKWIEQEYGCLFQKEVESMYKRSTQYLLKRIAAYRMAEGVIARGKAKLKGEMTSALRGGRRVNARKGTRYVRKHKIEEEGGGVVTLHRIR